MRIAVVGSYGSGRTTLSDLLADALGMPVSRASAMARPLGSPRVTAAEATPAELVQLTVRRLVERSVEETRWAGGVVSDGSVLHDWIYAEWLQRTGSFPAAVPPDAALDPPYDAHAFDPLTVVHQVALLARQDLAARYDVWFHLPVEFPLRDPVPPISEAFRAATDARLLGVLDAAGVQPHVLHGTPQQRLEQALTVLAAAGGTVPDLVPAARPTTGSLS